MSEIKVNNIQSLDGTHGPVISGTVEMNSTGAMSLPRGDTTYRGGRGRGLIGGGYTSGGPILNTISYITIASAGNATDFGDTTIKTHDMQGWGSSTRGFFAGGLEPGYRQNIDYEQYLRLVMHLILEICQISISKERHYQMKLEDYMGVEFIPLTD